MDILGKYTSGLMDGDIVSMHVLRVFDAAVNGYAECKHALKMFSDEEVRSVLDEDDYLLWQELKAARE